MTIEQGAAQADPTGSSPIQFTVMFSEAVTGFVGADVALSGTALPTTKVVTGGPMAYNVAVSGMTQSGTVVASVPGGVAVDGVGNLNSASTSSDNTVTFDPTRPSVTIEQGAVQADPTGSSPIHFTVVFSEAVTGFGTADVALSGTALPTTKVVTGGPTTYNVAVSGMTQSGTVVANIPAGGAVDAAGNSNTTSTSSDNTVTFDPTRPSVTIEQAAAQADPTGSSPIHFTVVFSEAVTGFGNADVALSGTALPITKVVTGGPITYNVAVSGMTQSGTVVANIPAGGAVDAAGNSNTISTSSDNTVTFDPTRPSVTIEQGAGQVDPATSSPIHFTVVFSEAVTGFGSADVALSGTALPITKVVTGGPMTYNVAVSGMTQSGTVVANIPAGGAVDAAGNSNTISTSSDNTVSFILPPKLSISGTVPNGSVVLSWPTNDAAFILVKATNLPATVWTADPASRVVLGGRYTVTNVAVGRAGFFRLAK